MQAGAGETCDGTAGTPGAGCRSDCTSCGDGVIQASHNETCDPPNTATCNAVCESAKVCIYANPELGAEATSFCSVLNDGGKVDITGPAGEFQGNLCIGDSGQLSMSGTNLVTTKGEVLLEPGASCAGCTSARATGGVVLNADLSNEIDACDDARAANTPTDFGGTGPACTETIKTLQDIVSGGSISRTGDNVICITNQQEVKKDIRLSGDATTKYVFVVKGKLKYSAKILTDCTAPQPDQTCTSAGVGPDDVLWLFVGANQELDSAGGGGGVGCCKAALDGNVIIDGKIALAPGLINGQVCGTGAWAFVSGSAVRCPDP
jgi:Fe-S cluster biogenesis protein NfuA